MSNTKELTSINLTPVQDRIVALNIDREILERESMYAARLIEADDKLQKCEHTSVALAVVDAASLGVTLNPTMQYAYLEPRWDSKRRKTTCYFRMMYQGIGYLMVKHGAATSFSVQCVHAADNFHADLGNLKKPITHKVAGFNRGEVVGVYALANLPDGTVIVELIDKAESDRILATSQSPAAKLYPNEFRRKTALKRLCKRLAKGYDESPLARAVEIDNREYTEAEIAAPAEPEPKPLEVLTPEHRHWDKIVKRLATGTLLGEVREHYLLDDPNTDLLLEAAVSLELNQERHETEAA